MKYLVAGSSSLETGAAQVMARLLALVLVGDPDPLVLLRRPRSRRERPGRFELGVQLSCSAISLPVAWYSPDTADRAHTGRAATLKRDMVMVDDADVMFLLFPDQPEPGRVGGTVHLLSAAIDHGTPCYAFTLLDPPALRDLASYDPDDRFGDLVDKWLDITTSSH